MTRMRSALIAGLLVGLVAAAGWAESPEIGLPQEIAGPAATTEGYFVQRAHYVMGTIFEIRGYGKDRNATAEAFEAAFAEIRKADELLSHYRDDSALTRLNREAARGPIEVEPGLYDVLALSRKFAELSDGAFDPTAGALVALWEEAEQVGRPPADEERQEILRHVGWRKVELLDGGRVRFRTSGVRVNFGAIGKGWALDRALAVLKGRGVHNALLSAGTSTVYALGSDRSGHGWRISLRDPLRPDGEDDEEAAAFYVRDGAVSTSADYERSLVIRDKRYSHIIDPRNGLPVGAVRRAAGGKILSATVQAPTAAEADALSTAVFVMGMDKGRDFLKRVNRQGWLIGLVGGEVHSHWVRDISMGESAVGDPLDRPSKGRPICNPSPVNRAERGLPSTPLLLPRAWPAERPTLIDARRKG